MSDTFYPGQKDYIEKLNTLATAAELADLEGLAESLPIAVAAAEASATAADTSADAAALSQSAAASSATGASTSATNAAASATSASGSASAASTSAGAAATSATNAAASATSASGSASAASTSAGAAATSATNAAASETSASGSASAASTSAGAAATSATNAAGSADLSEDWAVKMDGPVAGGEYSSKYWAGQAAATVSNQMIVRGGWDASTGVLPTPLGAGDWYKVTVAGIVASVDYAVDDIIWYSGTAWEHIGGADSGPIDHQDFNTSTTSTDEIGRLKWNDGDGTLEVTLKGGNVTLQIGQESVTRVYNNTGSTIADGSVVYVTGSQGNRPTVALASNSAESTSSATFAIATEAIANGAEGFVATAGLVRGLNTSAYAEGAAVWLGSTPGSLTTTKPTAPAHAVLLGWVTRQHATVGTIFVHVQNGYELDELHDVQLTSLANAQILQYESASGLWKNVSPTKSLVGLGNVDNTSDADKPISTATAVALSGKEPVLAAGTTTQYYRGDKSWQTLNPAAVGATTVGSNLLTLTDPASITFLRLNADNTVSALTAANYRIALGATTVGSNLFTLSNPGAITFPRFNADNSVSSLTAVDFRTAIGAGDVTTAGTQTLTNKTITAVSLRETKVAVAASAIDLSLGNYFTKTISGATTFTVSNVPTSGTVASFILDLTNGGSATITWWSGVKWAGGTAPTLTSAGVDILGFYTFDGGTTWRGMVLAKDSK